MRTRLSFLLVPALLVCFSAAGAQTMYSDSELTTGLGFGAASAVGDGEVFVGTGPLGWPQGDAPPGAVYRFVRDTSGEWVEAQRLRASDGVVGDHFGRSVHADGALLVIGAPGTGKAYVFEKDDSGDWHETGTLVPEGMAEGAEFGGQFERGGRRTQNIAMAGDRIVVDSYNADTHTGALHVFARAGNAWQQEALLTSGQEGDGFGSAVAASGNMVFSGASRADEMQGKVLAFTFSGGSWSEAVSITSPEISSRANLGGSVAFSDGLLFSGAPAFEGGGAVFVFAEAGGEWIQVGRLSPPEAQEGQRPTFGFGNNIATSETHILVTAGGSVQVFALNELSAVQALITPPDDRARRAFGTGISVSSGVAVIGSPSADYEAGLATLFEQTSTGEWTPRATLLSEISTLDAITGEEVRCEDGSAALFSCDSVDLVSFMPVNELTFDRGVTMTDIWGWTDPETAKEWVLIGRTEGVSFVDISDPAHPVFVGQLPKTEGTPGSSWRDMKVYRNHAYVVADGVQDHGIQVFDLTRLRNVRPSEMPVTFDETYIYDGIGSAHNIVINEDSGFAYAVGGGGGTHGSQCGSQLHIVDLQNPARPEFAGCFREEASRGTHDSQCVTYHGPDADYQGREVCLNSNGGSFVIGDVTDKDSTVTIAQVTYPLTAYTHQGWLTEDHRYFYMNDELDELNGLVEQTRTLIWDVSDLDDPVLASQYLLDSPASDHNLYIRGDLMYQSNYLAGLKILDISDRLNPVAVGHFDTAPYGEDEAGFGGSWSNYPWFESGVIAVSSRGEGLFLVRKQEVDM